MRLSKGDICAIRLPNGEGFIYFLYFGGNAELGYIVDVFDYQTINIEENIKNIKNQQSLFDNKYIVTYLPYYDNLLTKIGKISIDNITLGKINFWNRVSIEANRFNLKKVLNLSKNYTDSEYDNKVIKYALSGRKHIFNDWRIYEYGFDGRKFMFIGEYSIGILTEKEKRYMISGVAYLAEDIIYFFKNKIDRLRAEEIIFQ